jgi:non-heme chloroperoxidase
VGWRTLKVYEGAPHGLSMIPRYMDRFNADPLEFLRG